MIVSILQPRKYSEKRSSLLRVRRWKLAELKMSAYTKNRPPEP